MTLHIESLIACAAFILYGYLMSRNPEKTVFNYPPAIIGMISAIPAALMAGVIVIL